MRMHSLGKRPGEIEILKYFVFPSQFEVSFISPQIILKVTVNFQKLYFHYGVENYFELMGMNLFHTILHHQSVILPGYLG